MNLKLAYKILGDAEARPSGILKVRGREAAHEVLLMAEAGLVRADGTAEPEAAEAVRDRDRRQERAERADERDRERVEEQVSARLVGVEGRDLGAEREPEEGERGPDPVRDADADERPRRLGARRPQQRP